MTTASPSGGTKTLGISSAAPLVSLKAKLVLAVLGVALIGFTCYGIGANRDPASHVLSGHAYVSEAGQAAVTVDGWVYGFEVTANGMKWYDATGLHDGGIPPCLAHPGTAAIRFGYANTTGLNGDSWRVVTWVQCVAHS